MIFNNFKKRPIHITKSSGELERFSPRKLQTSLKRSGLSGPLSNLITKEVAKGIKPGESTKDIYKKAYKLVCYESPMAGIHYSLKRSIQDLGPAGYTFEQFVARYFQEIGYRTKVGVVLQGKYVNHEVDVVAQNRQEKVFIECKFHNDAGRKNDIKVALYVKARWDDLKTGVGGEGMGAYYLASNTTFTKDVIKYAEGTGLELLGVNAPAEENFLEKIKNHKLYPITSIKRLNKIVKDELIKRSILVCKDLLEEEKLLRDMGLKTSEIAQIFRDVERILEGHV